MRTLVTGGAGFIGSFVCESLIEAGWSVVALDNFDPLYARDDKVKNLGRLNENVEFALMEVDLRDSTALNSVFEGPPFDVVVHVAARAGVRASNEDPQGYIDTNITGTANLLDAMERASCRRLLFASSSSVYGDTNEAPFREDQRADHPVSPYAITKKAGEDLCYVYHASRGLGVTCLRFFSVYGPRQRPDMAIHKFVRATLNDLPIELFGDGTMSRDYTYVDDAVRGVMAAVEHLVAGEEFTVINIGSGNPVSLNLLIEMLERATGLEPKVTRQPRPPTEVRQTWADITTARTLLAWEPQVSFEEGLMRFVEWYRAGR